MKGILKYFILLVGLMFINVNIISADTCKVISGTGKDLGDEVSCGGENFYVISNDGTNTKLLSKYNLYVGNKIEKVGKTYYYDDYATEDELYAAVDEYYNSNVSKYPDDSFYQIEKYQVDDEGEINDLGVIFRLVTPLSYSVVKQDEKATGLKVVNGEVEYPIYGSDGFDDDEIENPLDSDGNIILEGTKAEEYFNEYKKYLNSKGINVVDINFIHRSGIESIAKETSDNDIDLRLETDDEYGNMIYDYDGLTIVPDAGDVAVYKVNIKEYIPEKYNWIFNTSFWVGSGSSDSEESEYPQTTDDFLTTYGDYCSNVRGCFFENNIGIGYRPVVTVLNSDIVNEEAKVEINPNTRDNIIIFVIAGIVSLIGIVILLISLIMKKKAKKIK